jgi:hypothetical protein
MEYLDFDLRISKGSKSEYTLAVVNSPRGQENATMHFPFDEPTHEQFLQALESVCGPAEGMRSVDIDRRALTSRQRLQKEPDAIIKEFGQKLFDALMSGNLHRHYIRSRDKAVDEEKGLRLRLRIEPPELAALPWEYLYDKSPDRVRIYVSTTTRLSCAIWS